MSLGCNVVFICVVFCGLVFVYVMVCDMICCYCWEYGKQFVCFVFVWGCQVFSVWCVFGWMFCFLQLYQVEGVIIMLYLDEFDVNELWLCVVCEVGWYIDFKMLFEGGV